MRLVRRTLHMGAAWILISVCLWALGAACLDSAIPLSEASHFSMRFDTANAPSFSGIERYYDDLETRKDNLVIPGKVTAWAEVRNRRLSATEWQADAPVDLYYVDGDVTDIMGLSLTAGGFPIRADKDGISIDSLTAVKLFGSSTPLDLELTLDGQKYTVRGVFKFPEGIPSFGADTGRGIAVLSPPPATVTGDFGSKAGAAVKVQGAEFMFPAGFSPDEIKNYSMQLAGSMGLGGAAFSKDYTSEDKMLYQLARLPGWAMMAVAALMLLYTSYSQTRMMIRLAWRRFRSRGISQKKALITLLRGILWGGILLAASAGIYIIIRPDFSLPPSYIPTRWSDLAFWPGLVKTAMLNRAERNALPLARPDAMVNTLRSWGTAFVLASVVSICFIKAGLYKVLGRPVYKRLRRQPDEGFHRIARWDGSCTILVLVSAGGPALGLWLAGRLGLRPVLPDTALTVQMLPIILISVELMLRLWPSALWPLRFSPLSGLTSIMHRSPGSHKSPGGRFFGKNKRKIPGLQISQVNDDIKG